MSATSSLPAIRNTAIIAHVDHGKTTFVIKKALQQGLKPIVVINKIDRLGIGRIRQGELRPNQEVAVYQGETLLGKCKASQYMAMDAKGRVRLEYRIPARGLIGFQGEFLTLTRRKASREE